MKWTDAALEDLAQMAAAGWTANRIARELGTSKNAVIGKAWRAGIGFKNGSRARKKNPEQKINPSIRLPGSPATIHQLGFFDCRWPIEEDERGVATKFCGKTRHGTSSYCKEHFLRSLDQTWRRKAAAA